MKTATVYKGSDDPFQFKVKISDIEIPAPGKGQVLIKVVVSGTNPKDWKVPIYLPQFPPHNTGDDVAGVVTAVGEGVTEFKPGDRVAALHELRTPFGSFAEYAIAWESTTFSLPNQTTFEEAATIPLAAITAAMGLHSRLNLPARWQKQSAEREALEKGGIVIYGAAGAVGAFAIKWLRRANLHPIIAVAGNGIPFVETLLDKTKGDCVVDYRKGDDVLVKEISEAVPKGQRLMYAFDTVSDHNSYANIFKVLDPYGHITLVLPGKVYEGIPETVHHSITQVGAVHGVPEDLWDFGYAYARLISLGLKQGWFSGHPYEVVPGGLDGVQRGLENLRDGRNSAAKYVYRIEETNGYGS
jgi:NADPH2:quinone reductase